MAFHPSSSSFLPGSRLAAGSSYRYGMPQSSGVTAQTSSAARSVEPVLLCQDPPLWFLDNFVSDEEIDHILQLATNWKPSKAQRVLPDGSARLSTDPQGTEQDFRTSWTCVLEPGQTAIVDRIERRLSQVAGQPLNHLECLALVRYSPGEFFKEHHDGRNRPRTVFLYLNDVPLGAGGETDFPALRLRCRPKKGSALMWDNTLPDGTADRRLVHAGLPPKIGVKYGINCFFNESIVRGPRSLPGHPEASTMASGGSPAAPAVVLAADQPQARLAMPKAMGGQTCIRPANAMAMRELGIVR